MTASFVLERKSNGGKINEGEDRQSTHWPQTNVVKGFLCDMTVEEYLSPSFVLHQCVSNTHRLCTCEILIIETGE
jgi:hypothetical protein